MEKVELMKQAAEAKASESEEMEMSLKSEVSIPPSSLGQPNRSEPPRSLSPNLRRVPSKGSGSFCLARYRSIRDHTGRYFLVVKIP